MKIREQKELVMLKMALVILIVLGAVDVAEAGKKPSCSDLNREWRTDYIEDFGLDAGEGGTMQQRFDCPSPESRLAYALWDLRHTKFEIDALYESPGSENWFYLYARNHINRMVFVHVPGCIFTSNANSEVRILTGCQNADVGKPWSIGPHTIIHEARHAEMKRNKDQTVLSTHEACNQGDFADSPNKHCDRYFTEDLHEAGSYSYTIKYTAWLTYRSDFDTLSKKYLKRLLVYRADNNFNTPLTKSQRDKWIRERARAGF
jgi:hypothetical protein